MLPLNLPNFDIKISSIEGRNVIFDRIRNKYVALTPEEWVRQNFVSFLIECREYPSALLANEVQIHLNNTIKRCDTILYGKDLSPKMVIEYKSPEVTITQNVFNQVTRYNMMLKVNYIIVSNGLQHYCCKINYEDNKCIFLKDIPYYKDL